MRDRRRTGTARRVVAGPPIAGSWVRIWCSSRRSSVPGLEPELVHEKATAAPVHLERVGLSSGAIQGEHELSAQALAQRVLLDEDLELGDDALVAAERELRLDAFLACGQAQLGEPPRFALDERVVREIGQRRALPERQRLLEKLYGPRRVALLPRLVEEHLEAVRVELLRLDPQPVPARQGLEHVSVRGAE